jgi:hypothetical protein
MIVKSLAKEAAASAGIGASEAGETGCVKAQVFF